MAVGVIRTGGREGKLRASSTWSAESLMGRESSVVRNVFANDASAMMMVFPTAG